MMNAVNTLDDRVALVTGGSRGIGRGIALALAAAGCDVAVNYHSQAALAEAVAAEVTAAGRRALAVQADVADGAAVTAMVQQVAGALGPVDVLINNAGIAEPRTLDEVTEADWDDHMAVNLKSAFLCTQAVVPGMRERGWGRIVNIASVAGFFGSQLGPHYAASKHGMIALTHYYAKQLFRAGVTCNAVAPGLTATEMAVAGGIDPNVVPVGRMGEVAEIADVVLCAVRTGFMTGETLHVNGGLYFG